MLHKKNLTNSPKQSPSVLSSSVLSPLVSSTKLFLNHVYQTTYIHSIFSIKDPKKKKTLLETEVSEVVLNTEKLKINKISNDLYFEISNEITKDLAEAVSLMMTKIDKKSSIWKLEIKNENKYIDPEKCLFWLTGGSNEWKSLENYNRPWSECYLEFQEEFGIIIFNIVQKSETIGEIRDSFIKYLNLPTIYDFAISKGFIR